MYVRTYVLILVDVCMYVCTDTSRCMYVCMYVLIVVDVHVCMYVFTIITDTYHSYTQQVISVKKLINQEKLRSS